MARPLLVGIVNITADSFSDGGRYLDPVAATVHARRLAAAGADIIELGAAASNVTAGSVSPDEEIGRLDPVLTALAADGTPLAVDTYGVEAQRFALSRGVALLNDIRGFPDPSVYPDLSASACRLVVMHAAGGIGRAEPLDLEAGEVWRRIKAFFAERIAGLDRAGIARGRLVLDPGMGLFLSRRPGGVAVCAGPDRTAEGDIWAAGHDLGVAEVVSRRDYRAPITGRARPGDTGGRAVRRGAGRRLHPNARPGGLARRAERDGGVGGGRAAGVGVSDGIALPA